MSFFNISLNDDIVYLLNEIGNNIKINNVDSKAIVNNASMERTFDDKRIITNEELRRGNYVQYNNLFFIVLNEINDMRYNSYYKGLIRKCNYDVKFVIDGKLYLFYSIIESDKFSINETKIIDTSADTITVTIPATNITKQIKVNDRIVKFNCVWDITGIDYTKNGLVILQCKKGTYDPNKDDLELEIASKDKLTNTTIIYPFDIIEPEITTLNIIDVETFTDVEVENGTKLNNITLPTVVTVTLEDNTTTELSVVWDTSTYNGDVAGTYTFVGTITLVEGITNTNNKTASINVIVKDVPIGDNYTITISGADEILLTFEETYIAKVLNNDTEVTDKQVTFSLSNKLATIKSQGNNQCTIKTNENYDVGDVTLKATLVDDSTIFTEKQIFIRGL